MNYKMKNRKLVATAAATLVASALAGWSTMAFADSSNIQTDISMVNPDNNCKFEVNSGQLGDVWTFTANTQAGTSSMTAQKKTNELTVVADGSASCKLTSVHLAAATPNPRGPFARGRAIHTANGGYFYDAVYLSEIRGYTDPGAVPGTQVSVRVDRWRSSSTSSVAIFDGTNTPRNAEYGTADRSSLFTATGQSQPPANTEFSYTAAIYDAQEGPFNGNGDPEIPGSFTGAYGALTDHTIVPSDAQDAVKRLDIQLGSLTTTHPLGAGNVADDLTVYDGESLSSTWTITVTPA